VRELAMDHRKPAMSLWVQLVGEMHVSARKDSSLWGHINSTLYAILELYPDSVGQKLMSIGLESSVVGEDPRLAAGILRNISRGLLSESIEERAPVDIPYQAVRSALEVCLKLSDVSSAESIMESICEMGDLYPTGILAELYALLLLCHAKSGQTDEALSVLFTMTEKRMQPG
jgi:pentatricopeptide repeat protein